MATLPPQEDDCTIQFVCPSCTYINRRYDKMCEMCMTDRPLDQLPDKKKSTEEPRKNPKKVHPLSAPSVGESNFLKRECDIFLLASLK